MDPTPVVANHRSPFSGPGAFVKRLALFLLSSTLVLVLAGSALAQIDAPRPVVAQPLSGGGTTSVLPDLVVSIQRADARVVESELVPLLRTIPGVAVARMAPLAQATADNSVAVLVTLTEAAAPDIVDSINAGAQQVLPNARVSVGGRAVADQAILDRLNRGTIVAIVPVLLLVAILLSAGLGIRTGLSAGATIGLSTLLGALVASRLIGDFDGTVSTTALPAALASVLVSSVLTFRLLDWFKHPSGTDAAASIRLSVRSLLPEVGLMVGGLLVTVIALAIMNTAPAAAIVVTTSAVLAALVTVATLPSMLASQPPVHDEDDYRLFRMALPDGRDFPLAVLAGFACFLLSFGLVGVQTPSAGLLDESALSTGVAAQRALAVDALASGDPTSAIVASFGASSSAEEQALWAATASDLAPVGFVDTSVGRFLDGSLVGSESLVDAPDRAIVGLVEHPRSDESQDVVTSLRSLAEPGGSVSLSGTAVDAAALTAGSITQTWLLIGVLALVGAVAILILLRDSRVAVASFTIRVVGTSALVGIYFIVAAQPTAFELQVAVLISNVGVGLFELGLLHHLVSSDQIRLDPGAAVTSALRSEGRAGLLGVGITGLCGFGLLASDLLVARQLGIGLAAGLAIEILLGMWLLRPVLLGEALVWASERRDLVQVAVATVENRIPNMMDLTWRRTISVLLRDEFAFQQDPERAELSTVFVEGTALFGELTDHNKVLRRSGLRVVGRGPIVRKVAVIEQTSPVCLSICVDHPSRQLVDPKGRIVGERPAERRDGMVWLMQDSSGRHRIFEAIDLGRVASSPEPIAAAVPASAIPAV